jgi:GNAT superfamily N-acetyltransferase
LQEIPSPSDGREKRLALTAKGRNTLAAIDRYAEDQVIAALEDTPVDTVRTIIDGLEIYANALARKHPCPAIPAIRQGYTGGLFAAIIGMHAAYYSRETGFGEAFETRVARDLAEFMPRVGRPQNGIWHAVAEDRIIGAIAIDGEDLGASRAHLRWFIVGDTARGTGLGRKLLSTALEFCDAHGFDETHLWTFRGLDAARKLYEDNGFVLAGEWSGDQWGKQVMEQKFVRPHP